MNILLLIVAIITIIFGFVVFFGAPYLPTTKRQIAATFKLLKLPKGGHLLELGAGDGRVALWALKKGYRVTAIELNPLLCAVIFVRTFKYRRKIKIICGNFWQVAWPATDGIFVFLLDKYMARLDARITRRYKGVRLASFAFKVPDKKIIAEKEGVYLYKY